jgi:hypothetical protein
MRRWFQQRVAVWHQRPRRVFVMMMLSVGPVTVGERGRRR